MSRWLKELLALFVLGLAVALIPIACGGSNDNGDGGDRVDGMTQT
jgi:hypothetical protein